MELEYIKANGTYYIPQEAGIKDESKNFSNYPVCLIKKLPKGMYQVDYYDRYNAKYYSFGDEDKPNARVILYPNGIEEIRYK